MRAAITTGSTVLSGAAPWPPRPKMVRSTESTLAIAYPGIQATFPAGRSELSWTATEKSGFGNRLNRPSAIIARAPCTVSSAGWPIISTVPRQRSFIRARSVAAPVQPAMCTSCPQACITGTVCPAGLTPVAVLAYGNPVFSSTGSASSSVRRSTVGPFPLRSTPTTPVPPTPVVTSYPSLRSSSAMRADVRCSFNDSSGFLCRST